MKEKQIGILRDAPVTQAILKLSIPVVLGMMVQVFYNLVDTYFIGRLGDPNQLAAANITTPLFMIMMSISGIIGTGGASYISRCLGEKNYDRASQTLSTGIAIIIGLGAVVTFLGLGFDSQLMYAMGASEQVYPFALDYASVLFMGSIAIMCSFTLGQLMRSEGAAVQSIIGMALGTVTNIILDPVFIFGFDMGIRGAAIATVLGNLVSVVYYIYYYASKKCIVKFSLKKIGLNKTVWGQIWSIGTPASLSQLLMSVAIITCNNLAMEYGNVVVAVMGVANKIMTIGTFIFIGFAAGCQPLVGFNYGAKNYGRVNQIIKKAMLITICIGVVLFVLFSIFAGDLINVFADGMPEVVAVGTVILRALMWSLIVLGPQMLAMTTVQALGKAKASLFLSIARQGLLFIPLLFLLNSLFAFGGMIYAQPVSDGISVLISLLVLRSILKKAESENLNANNTP